MSYEFSFNIGCTNGTFEEKIKDLSEPEKLLVKMDFKNKEILIHNAIGDFLNALYKINGGSYDFGIVDSRDHLNKFARELFMRSMDRIKQNAARAIAKAAKTAMEEI